MSQSILLSEPVVQLYKYKYKLKIVIKSTRNSWSLICPISPHQPKSQIIFGKKSPSQDFICKTFVICTYCLAACAEMDNQLAAHYRQDSWWCHKQISNSVSLHYYLEAHAVPHSQIKHYFFSYLLTCEVYLIKVIEISAQILQYITFFSLKAIKISSDFILNYLKKVVGGATTEEYQKQRLKPWYFLYGSTPRGPSRGVKRCTRIH